MVRNIIAMTAHFMALMVCVLSKMEKMYAIIKSGNPSCWLGPIWGVSNYMVFEGLCRYGYIDDAKELAEKTITLFGKDLEQCGQMHDTMIRKPVKESIIRASRIGTSCCQNVFVAEIKERKHREGVI